MSVMQCTVYLQSRLDLHDRLSTITSQNIWTVCTQHRRDT